MTDQLTKANINLYAILRNIEDLCELDNEMMELIKDRNISIQFSVSGGPNGYLMFKDGRCRFKKGKEKCTIKLYFKSPEHFNEMIEGNANPIPLKGFTKVNFLKNEFIKLTEKLTYYLKPTEELLKDKTYFKINTILSAYTAFFTLGEIGNTDKIGKFNARRIPDGVISVAVLNGGPSIYIKVKNGQLEVKKGNTDLARAHMIFKDIETASAILNGKVDSYTCIASGKLELKGFIPMIDNMNKLLAQVPVYLK
jgi:putative sterol carrier protein